MGHYPVFYHFVISPNSTILVEYQVPVDSLLRRFFHWFLPNQQALLKISPLIDKTFLGFFMSQEGSGITGNEYLIGDDYIMDIKIALPVRQGIKLGIKAQNIDTVDTKTAYGFWELEDEY